MTTRSVAGWYGKHAGVLSSMLKGTDSREKEGLELAKQLEEAENVFLAEQRGDVDLTNRRDAAIEQARRLVTSGVAAAEIAYHGSEDLGDVVRDFSAGAPSRIRTVAAAGKALQRLIAGFDRHEAKLAERLKNVPDLRSRAEKTLATLREFADERAGENTETSGALRDRDRARALALDYIDRCVLEAGAVEFEDDTPLAELRVVFDTHNSPPRADGAQPDSTDGATDDGEFVPTDDEPTDSGGDFV